MPESCWSPTSFALANGDDALTGRHDRLDRCRLSEHLGVLAQPTLGAARPFLEVIGHVFLGVNQRDLHDVKIDNFNRSRARPVFAARTTPGVK